MKQRKGTKSYKYVQMINVENMETNIPSKCVKDASWLFTAVKSVKRLIGLYVGIVFTANVFLLTVKQYLSQFFVKLF